MTDASDDDKTKQLEAQINEYNDRSREIYLEIISLDPTNPRGFINAGVLEAKLGNISSALQYLNKAKSLSPFDHRIHLNIGKVYLKDQNFKFAIEHFKEALCYSPGNLKILKPYVICLSKLELFPELEEICILILEIDRKNPLALAFLTRAMKENEKFEILENVLTRMNKKLENY